MNELTNRVKIVYFIVLSSLAVLVGSCGDHKQSLSLIPAPAKPQSDAETLRKAELQSIQVFGFFNAAYFSIDPQSLVGALNQECGSRLGIDAGSDDQQCDFPNIALGQCERRLCGAAANLCAAQLMKKLATEPGTVLTLNFGADFPQWRIEPQSTGANAAIMVRASVAAMAAAASSAAALDAMVFHSPSGGVDYTSCNNTEAVSVTPNNGTATTFAKIAANTFVEAAQFSEELVSEAADAVLASADSELSSSLSPTLVANRAISGSSLSRGQAIRTLVSDTATIEPNGSIPDTGIEGLPQSSICSVTELTSQGRRALDLLRAAAPPPADVKNLDLLTPDFLNADRDSGSIKQRLAQFWGRTIAGNIEDAEQLTGADFEAAREYLQQELGVFARSDAQTYTSQAGRYDRFASTATEPQDRDPAYWGAVTRYRTFFNVPSHNPAQLKSEDAFSDVSFPENRFMYVSAANRILANIDNLDESQRSVGDQLALLASTMQARAPGFIRFDADPSTTQILLEIDTPTQWTKFVILQGESGLHCATQGAIEGVPCTAADLAGATVCNLTDPPFVDACAINTPTLGAGASGPRFYVVGSKSGGTGPGQYVSLIGASPFYVADRRTSVA